MSDWKEEKRGKRNRRGGRRKRESEGTLSNGG